MPGEDPEASARAPGTPPAQACELESTTHLERIPAAHGIDIKNLLDLVRVTQCAGTARVIHCARAPAAASVLPASGLPASVRPAAALPAARVVTSAVPAVRVVPAAVLAVLAAVAAPDAARVGPVEVRAAGSRSTRL